MKVLHVLQTLARNFGGPPTVLYDLVTAQSEAGLDVDVVSTNIDVPHGVLPVAPNRFIEYHGGRMRYCSVEFRPLLFSWDLKRYIDQNIARYDIAHIHGLYRFPPTYAAWQARRQGVPYVIRPHGSLDPYLYGKSTAGSVWLKRLYERWFDLPNLHAAGAIHYTAEEERERASFLGLKAPSFVVPNGLDWTRYRELPARGALRARWGLGEAPVVLFLGRLHFKKGLDLLIPAFDALRRRVADVQLVIAGPENDNYGQQVRGWVRERGLEAAVHFVGPLHGADVMQAYVDADVFALPSYTENFGMTVVEAMACACPVVVSDQVNIWRGIREEGAGLVVGLEPAQIADAICRVLEDKEAAREMGRRGRLAAEKRYAWPQIVEQLTDIYRRLIAEKAAVRRRAKK